MLKNFLLIMVSLVMITKGFSQEGRSFYGSFESNGVYYQENEDEK